MSAKRTSWNEFSSSMTSAVICLSTEIEEERDADEHVEEVNPSDAAHGDDSAAHGEVPTVTAKPCIPSPTPLTPPPQPSQDIPSTSQVNDITRLQALVDKKKVVVTEAILREVLYLDDAEGINCLPNEEIFTELARMGYEKPSTKLTFYKAFFSSQWKFLIHTISQCMSAKRTSWNEFSSSMTSAVICLSTEIEEERDADEHVEEVNPSDAAHGDDSAAHGEVPTVTAKPCIPSPTPLTPPPQPSQDIPSTSQVQQTPPQSPQ
nr:hypothetical protein [Tanacetum cinerariifolium]